MATDAPAYRFLIRLHREAAGLTREQLADGAGVDLGHLVALEEGLATRDADTAWLLANWLNVAVGAMFSEPLKR